MYQNVQGHFSFQPPTGWKEISTEKLKEFNQDKPIPFDFGFQKGDPYPYFLGQIRFNRKVSKNNVETYIAHATPVENLTDIAENIKDGSYLNRDLYYTKHQFFIMIAEYDDTQPILSFMAKKYSSYGYVIIHYYLSSPRSPEELVDSLKNLSKILDTFEYDQEYKFTGE